MPYKAGRPCRGAGCNKIVYGKGKPYCEGCLPLYVKNDFLRRGTPSERGYNSSWRKIREAALDRNPLCVDPFGTHKEIGETVLADEVHHIKPLKVGGTNEDKNLAPLCKSCHSRITALEIKRGRYVDELFS